MNENNNNVIPQPNNTGYTPQNGTVVQPGTTVMVVQPDGTLVPQTGAAMITQADGSFISQDAYNAAIQQTMGENVFVESDKGIGVDDVGLIYCPKCGSSMKKESRYCMKCGNLNYAHPENETMKQYAWQSIKQGNYISGVNIDDRGEPLEVPKQYRYRPYLACFIVNVLIHLGIPILLTVLAFVLDIDELVRYLWIAYVTSFVMFIANYSMQSIYIKSGERWWSYYIPIYSQYVYYEITMGAGWMFILSLVPGVNMILMMISSYRLGKKFDKNGWLTMFFPMIMIPIIGLGPAQVSAFVVEPGITENEADSRGRTRSEREYKRKKIITGFLVIVSLIVVGYFVWPFAWDFIKEVINIFTESLEFFR